MIKAITTQYTSISNQNRAFHADIVRMTKTSKPFPWKTLFRWAKEGKTRDYEDFCLKQGITSENEEAVMRNLGIEPFCYSLIMLLCMLTFISCENLFTLTTFLILAVLTVATLLHNMYFMKIIEDKKYFSFFDFIMGKGGKNGK
jgi:hypothetical protein